VREKGIPYVTQTFKKTRWEKAEATTTKKEWRERSLTKAASPNAR